jgi:hypothetical protein
MRRTLLLSTVVLLAACGEDKPKPHPPTIVGGSALAQCRREGTDSVFQLHHVEVIVEDKDGADDLDQPQLLVLSSRLVPTGTPQPTDDNRIQYVWDAQASDEPIYCGEDGKGLNVKFQVEDMDGYPASVVIGTRPL